MSALLQNRPNWRVAIKRRFGHATAAPPTSMMNSRRFIADPNQMTTPEYSGSRPCIAAKAPCHFRFGSTTRSDAEGGELKKGGRWKRNRRDFLGSTNLKINRFIAHAIAGLTSQMVAIISASFIPVRY